MNDDPGAGINPNLPVNIEDPANADVTGGSLTGGVNVPWAVFRQKTTGTDQVFSRSFAGGKWTTRGNGTVGGRSSAAPTFSGSLNFDQGQDGEAPSIDFAGANRAVPWATWYEKTTGTGPDANNIFASRFDNTSGKWVFAGQGRGLFGGSVQVPSLNIHTNRDAENPVVAGGSAADPTKPGPWVTWQEQDLNDTTPGTTSDQIFVSKPLGPGQTNCTGVTPTANDPSAAPPGGFCFQQVGIGRVNVNADPSLNVDRTRDGIEPDIAFTGANDSVPWVVWYEQGTGALASNDQVFAAKGLPTASLPTPPTGTVQGGFGWVAVGGNGGSGLLDKGASGCSASSGADNACSLNAAVGASAVDPRVAAGTMTAGAPTSPWVAWEETSGGHERIFVSRLVNGAFKLANGGAPLPTVVNGIDATRPDITFSGNTPYVTWHEGSTIVSGHFTTPDSFVIDNSPVGTNVAPNVRAPISSGCTADPFNGDGATCQATAAGTPFFLFSDGGSADAKLFAKAYQPDAPVTLGPTGVSTTAGTMNGSVNPQGAAVKESFDFGPTAAYGQTTPAQKSAVSNSAVGFSANLTGLAPGTTIHYRAVVTSDFKTFIKPDQTLQTASAPPPPPPPAGTGHASVGHVTVSGKTATVPVKCSGTSAETCKLTLTLTVTETLRGHKVIAVSARKQPKTHKQVVVVGRTHVTLTAGHSRSVQLTLNSAGRKLLAAHHTLRVTLHVTETLANGHSAKVATRTVVFHAPRRHHKH